jgi:hypothetical protein
MRDAGHAVPRFAPLLASGGVAAAAGSADFKPLLATGPVALQ